MPDVIPFDPRRFQTAAQHYLAGRPAYAPALIDRVAQLVGLRSSDRVLDLGCGPGQLARAFAPMAAEVVGVDPEPEMLEIAAAAPREFPNIVWRKGSSYDLSPELGRFRLICMGRSFHWMDRVDTLHRLEGMIEPGGAVALFNDRHPDVPDNAWHVAYRDVLERYRSDDPLLSRQRGPDWVRHEAVLLDSAFSRVEEISVYERREVTADKLIDRALSMSSTTRAKLAGRTDEMIEALRATLPAENLREVVASVAMIAWRP